MTHEKAAEIVGSVGSKESYIDWAVSDKQRKAFQIAARVLRSVATASADAEKSYEDWLDANDCFRVGTLSWMPREAYAAGHAAATAARQADMDALRVENETLYMTIVACDVGAMSNTLESAASQRLPVEWLDNLIVHLGEYWNGNENERAMADMCWHVISECDKAKADRPVRVAEILKRWKEQQT